MSDNTREQREKLLSLLRTRAYRRGKVTLSSGQVSDFYFDGRMVELMPEGAYLIGEAVFDEIKEHEFDAIGGLAVGAVPIVTATVISCFHHQRKIEGIFVRSEPKGHGTQKVVEGMLRPGARVVILDDVATTGKSLMRAIEAVEAEGARVELVLVLVDRQEGAEAFFQERGYRFRRIFTKEQVMEADHVAAG